jgi:hypothetical protein
MYFDEDGDLAHAFYEEVSGAKAQGKAFMRRITKNLRPQVCRNSCYINPLLVNFLISLYIPFRFFSEQIWTKYPHPRLRYDSPEVLVEVR